MNRVRILLYAVVSAAVAGFWAKPSAGQPVISDDELQPIVVTAQRRPELAKDVPISLTTLSGARLEQMQASDMAGLAKLAPSLVMMRTGAPTQPYLRGVGKRSTLGVENSVATYIDGVYLASPLSALLDLRGVDRVEILNGPQGTLFGRNTTGGVIQIITRDPSPDTFAEAELHLGSYGYARGDAYVTGGNADVAGNLAVSLSRNNGYGTNIDSGKKEIGRLDHSLVARSKLIWRPTSTAKVTLSGDYQDIDQDFTQLPVTRFPPIGEPRVLDFRDADQDFSTRYRFRYGGASLKIDIDLGKLTFMSLSAARWMHALYGADLDAGPLPLLSAAPNAYQNQVSQEFQLQSSASSPVSWVAGLYYIHIGEKYDPTNFNYGGTYSTRLGGRIEQLLYDTGRTHSYAAYGQATLSIARHTRLTAGLRETVEDRSVRAQGEQLYDNPPFLRPIPGLPLITQEPLRNSERFRELTWRASLDRDLSGAVMTYISASRGFQSGGWNLQTPQIPGFRPEKLDAFEGGLKFVDRAQRISADTSAFYYNYEDLQVSAFTPLGSITTNATSATIYGLDAQIDALVGARTNVAFGAQLLEAHYNSFPNATCTDYNSAAAIPYVPISCDATGNRLPFAPRLKFNIGGTQQVSLARNGSLLLSGNLNYNSGYFSEPDNVVRQHAFATVDASVEWRRANTGPSIEFWIRNLTNAHYYESLVTFPTAGVLQRPAAPRRFGISLSYTS